MVSDDFALAHTVAFVHIQNAATRAKYPTITTRAAIKVMLKLDPAIMFLES
jgi:hypothetical protein